MDIKNNLYYSNDSWLDFDNLELMFLYVENYKQFEKLSLNLNAKYLFKYKKGGMYYKLQII